MWNDEDNNPYGGSFERRDSFASSANPSSPVVHECEFLSPARARRPLREPGVHGLLCCDPRCTFAKDAVLGRKDGTPGRVPEHPP